MNIVAFHGSPRNKSNSSRLLQEFLSGAGEQGAQVYEVYADRAHVRNCRGCLRCNLLKRCAIKGDAWDALSTKILNADALAFASPVYFHHVSAPLKTILDRFRSFLHVQITAQGLNHTAWLEWKKHFVIILAQGSPDDADAKPVIDLFAFLAHALGPENSLHPIVGTRLAVGGQISLSRDELRALYAKLDLPAHLTHTDYERNQALLQSCYDLGCQLAKKNGP